MSEQSSDYARGNVTVLSDNVFDRPLLDTNKARTVVIRSNRGEPVAFMSRIVDDTWCFANKSDSDWEEAKARFGIS